jgi:hypothetical protein
MEMKMNNFLIILLAFTLCLVSATSSRAELTPEVQLGIKGVFSLDYTRKDGSSDATLANFDDTSILLGFKEKLYSDYRGQFVVSMKFTDPDSDLGPVFYNHLFLKMEDQKSDLLFGRSRASTTLIEFPTLRDDDTLLYSDILNPHASATTLEPEEYQYASMLRGSYLVADKMWLQANISSFKQDPVEDFGVNAAGIALEYLVPESQRWNRKILQQIGFGFNTFLDVEQPGGSSDNLINTMASLVLNVKPDPVHFWDLRAQTIFNNGLAGIDTLGNLKDMSQAESISLLASLRYLNRKLEWPNAQVALTAAYKNFPDLLESTNQYEIIINGLHRIGSGFDVGLQLAYDSFTGDLENLFGKDELRVQAFLTFEFDAKWNNQFDDRGSLLNLEHGYIP